MFSSFFGLSMYLAKEQCINYKYGVFDLSAYLTENILPTRNLNQSNPGVRSLATMATRM
jgi:hypothetical protein